MLNLVGCDAKETCNVPVRHVREGRLLGVLAMEPQEDSLTLEFCRDLLCHGFDCSVGDGDGDDGDGDGGGGDDYYTPTPTV